ncbi:unnamed protein product [Lactuca virosa]|uniref:Uncharacterized protein n=1 Tax=Lactuca virosa TaxID=75947 RepID=A0AAU9LE88_9ASTR|nr:unnamed protein product [Lactuca virosa]
MHYLKFPAEYQTNKHTLGWLIPARSRGITTPSMTSTDVHHLHNSLPVEESQPQIPHTDRYCCCFDSLLNCCYQQQEENHEEACRKATSPSPSVFLRSSSPWLRRAPPQNHHSFLFFVFATDRSRRRRRRQRHPSAGAPICDLLDHRHKPHLDFCFRSSSST